MQCAEDEKLEEALERRRMEGSSVQLEVMQKAPMLVVRERMSQGKHPAWLGGMRGREEETED